MRVKEGEVSERGGEKEGERRKEEEGEREVSPAAAGAEEVEK